MGEKWTSAPMLCQRSRHQASTGSSCPVGAGIAISSNRVSRHVLEVVDTCSQHSLEVFDGRERVVEVVQETLPFLVAGRLAEAHSVVLQRLPLDQQEVPRRVFDAAL